MMSNKSAITAPLSAHDAWAQLGWPTTRLETWRYFPLRAYEGRDPAKAPAPASIDAERPAADVWAIVNGLLNVTLSPALKPGGTVSVQRHHGVTPAALGPDGVWADGMEAANAAFGEETIVIDVPANVHLDAPVRVVVTSIGETFSHPRLKIRLGAGAAATVIVEYRSEGDAFTNVVTAIELGPDSSLQHAMIINDDLRACHVEYIDAQLDRGASWKAFTATARGGAARTAANIHLLGEAADATFDGIYLPTGQSRFDHQLNFDHVGARTQSHATWAAAIDDRGVGTFLGCVRIGQDVKGCQTRQLTRSLLLSPSATANAKPELHIDCDEVEASHGATIGQLDAQQLFYLISRGLDPRAARDMLIHAFVRDAIGRAPIAAQALISAVLGVADDVDELDQLGALDDA